MQLLLKDDVLLEIQEDGFCKVLDFDRLPLMLRKENVIFEDFVKWASNRILPIWRCFAKQILYVLRLPVRNPHEVCMACRGLSLNDSYWIRQEEEYVTWKEVNLFQNVFPAFVTEVSLSGKNVYNQMEGMQGIYTPELTTAGANAKGWIRRGEKLYLHKTGRYEIPAANILSALEIRHIGYELSDEGEIGRYLSKERRQWLIETKEVMVNSELFTSENTSFVTFEEFKIFCEDKGWNPLKKVREIDHKAYLQMQIADYILNNNDRHCQNWGFMMDNQTGKLMCLCPLFDHDYTFCENQELWSQKLIR